MSPASFSSYSIIIDDRPCSQDDLWHSLFLYLSLPSRLVAADLNCRPEGPVLPKPTSLCDSSIFQKAASNFTDTLDAAISNSINPGWAVENVSFSLAVISADQNDPGVPIWEYHRLASGNNRGTRHLGRNSQYLIGSITKVFSDYILMKSGIDLDVPVTNLLPRLLKPHSTIQWQNITLRMLASHLSRAPTNYTLDGVIKDYPITVPMERPAYSNIAFTIFGMAHEEFTGKGYSQLVEVMVAKPLGLENTFPSPGNDQRAVIPPIESTWGADYGYSALHPHPITIYGKSGGAQGYRSQLSVVNEYGFALVVLTAGPTQAAPILVDAIMATFVPVIDGVSRDQAKKHERNFTSMSSKEDDVFNQQSLQQDEDSLLMSSLHRNGSDHPTGLTELWTVTPV
ncbi:Fc.00g045210.m01.CDS01 [Cosmosporella sp. VM-42]